MDLSVVVLSWNTAELTLRALRAAREGAGTLEVEVVCVDNGSGDGTPARVRRELPEVGLIENGRNLGFAAGNNRALATVTGRVVCFLNSDAAPSPGSLAHVVAHMDAHPEVGIAAPRLVGPDGLPQRAARREPELLGLLHRYTALGLTPIGRRAAKAFTTGEAPSGAVRDVASVTGACLLVRRDLLLELGGFDEGYPFYWEDVDLCRRARARGARVVWVEDGPPVRHEGGAATKVRGGPPRYEMAVGLLRYAARAHGERAARAFAAAFVPGVLLRALLEPSGLALRALLRALKGEGARARETQAAAVSWLWFLERDAGRVWRLLAPPRCDSWPPA